MNQRKPIDMFKKKVALLSLFVLWTHLSVSLYLTLNSHPARQNSFITFYKGHLLPGPFFRGDHLKISPHLYIRYKNENGSWSDFSDFGKDDFSEFINTPWRYDKLKQSDYLRHIMRQVYLSAEYHKVESFKNNREFLVLNDYVKSELLPETKIDSIQMVYVFQNYTHETREVKLDTVLNLKYNPKEIESAQ